MASKSAGIPAVRRGGRQCAYGPDGEAQLADYTSGALWESMSAVESGQAYPVDDEVWMTGIGVTAAGMILDDLETHIQS